MLVGDAGEDAEGIMTPDLFDNRIPDYLWEYIIPEPNSGCWLWLGTTAGARGYDGYGSITFNSEKEYTHRFFYEKLIGQIPDRKELDHLCRVRICCNPTHLEPVYHFENARRGTAGMNNVTKWQNALTCDRGHPWTVENTGTSSGWRRCRTCAKIKMRWYRAGKIGRFEDYE